MRFTDPGCYLCGNIADGPRDHVPPEVLFRGVGGSSYKSPEIITVPSCREHNEGASQDDEVLAWIMSDAGALHSRAGFDVYQALLSPVSERIHSDRKFVDERLQHGGIRVLRDPKDYDDNGIPKTPVYEAEYVNRVERSLRDRWAVLERSLQKVAAGIFFHATKESLGLIVTRRLSVVVPDFKQIGTTITLTGLDADETDFFSKNWPWQSVVSGSPEVFQCSIARPLGSNQFAMKMLFFESVRVWVAPHNCDVGAGP